MADECPFFVAGEWRHGDRSVPVTGPADGSVVARVSQAGREGVRCALEEADTEPRRLAVNGALTELG